MPGVSWVTGPSQALPYRSVVRVWITCAPPPCGVSTNSTVRSPSPTPPLWSAALIPVLPELVAFRFRVRVVGSVLIVNAAEAAELE